MWLKRVKPLRELIWYLRHRRTVSEHYKSNLKRNGKEYAELCKQVEILEHRKCSSNKLAAAVEKKTDYVISHIKASCSDIFDRIIISGPNIQTKEQDERNNTIWVFWWSGESEAPDLVKACINSIRKNANGNNVVVLDKNSYTEYVHLPDHILAKHYKGLIGHAHFSDILRLSLLAEYGGVWIDATVFLSQPLPKHVTDGQFYSLRAYDPDAVYPSKSRWCTYFLAGKPSFPLFSFARDCLIEYWKKNDKDIEYLLFDYVILIAYQMIPLVKETIDKMPDNNPYRMELMAKIKHPYSEKLFSLLSSSDTFVSKLSWRYKHLLRTTETGTETNYGHFLKLYLPTCGSDEQNR